MKRTTNLSNPVLVKCELYPFNHLPNLNTKMQSQHFVTPFCQYIPVDERYENTSLKQIPGLEVIPNTGVETVVMTVRQYPQAGITKLAEKLVKLSQDPSALTPWSLTKSGHPSFMLGGLDMMQLLHPRKVKCCDQSNIPELIR